MLPTTLRSAKACHRTHHWCACQVAVGALPVLTRTGTSALPFSWNRAVIERNSSKQLVYYWFVQRGRKVANEYWSKWYLFADAIAANRTDGALVRVTTPFAQGETENAADKRLQAFIAEMEPRLTDFSHHRQLSEQQVGSERRLEEH